MAEAQEVEYFDLRTVHDNFVKSLLPDDDIELLAYLDAYKELYKLANKLFPRLRAVIYIKKLLF